MRIIKEETSDANESLKELADELDPESEDEIEDLIGKVEILKD